jgi:hypothetical protein
MYSPPGIDSMEWPPRGIPEELDTVFATETRTELESEALDLRLSMLYADTYNWFQLSGVGVGEGGVASNSPVTSSVRVRSSVNVTCVTSGLKAKQED